MRRTVKVSDLIEVTKDEETKKEIEHLGKTRNGIGKTRMDPYPDYHTIIKPK